MKRTYASPRLRDWQADYFIDDLNSVNMKNRITMPLRLRLFYCLLLSTSFPLAGSALPTDWTTDSIPNEETVEFLLQGVARNGDTGENFDHIYVDVYKLLPDGSVAVVRTDRFPGGTFEVWLRRDERYMLMMNYNNTAFLEGLLNPADARIIDGVLSQVFILDEYRPDLLTEKTEEETPAVEATNGLLVREDPKTPAPEPTYAALNEDTPDEEQTAMSQEPPATTPESQPAPPEESLDEPLLASDEEMPSEESEGEQAAPEEPLGAFYLTGATSFRSEATHLSESMLRFATGDKVILLEKTDKYWWKVRFKSKTGWVKAAKLQEEEVF